MKDILFFNSIVFGTLLGGILIAQTVGPRYTIVAYSVASRPIGPKPSYMEVTVISGWDQRKHTALRKCLSVDCPLENMTPHVEQAIREGLK